MTNVPFSQAVVMKAIFSGFGPSVQQEEGGGGRMVTGEIWCTCAG